MRQTPTAAAARTGKGLPDHVRPGLRVLFVGINPGMRSEQVGHHFAGYSNRFWKLLRESRLVPEPIRPQDDARLLEWGYGITNLVRRATPGIEDLEPADYEAGRRRLVALIRRNHPAIVALVGVTLYRVLFGARPGASAHRRARPTGASTAGPAPPPLGLRDERLGGAPVFVLPNPSGRNANFSYGEMLAAFRELRQRVPKV
jgi:TDG/mug DNA glycosylase family protein